MALTSTTGLGNGSKKPLCHGCRKRVPIVFPDENGTPMCRVCFERPAHDLIRHEDESEAE